MRLMLALILLAGASGGALAASPAAPPRCMVGYVYFRAILVECPAAGLVGVLNRGLDGLFRGELACAGDKPACVTRFPILVSEERGGYVGAGVPLECAPGTTRLTCHPVRDR